MKFLAFLFATALLAPTVQAQTASAGGAQTPINIGPAPSWGGVIDRYAREGMPEPTENIDSKLTTESYSEQERAAKAGAKADAVRRAATGAKVSASGGAGAATAENLLKAEAEDEFSKAVKGTVKELAKPFQEALFDPNAERKPDADQVVRPVPEAQGQPAHDSLLPAPQAKPKNRRLQDKLDLDHMLEELVQELKPWAIGAAFLAFVGFCINLWMLKGKRKKQRASAGASRHGPPSGYSPGSPRSQMQTQTESGSGRKKSRVRIRIRN